MRLKKFKINNDFFKLLNSIDKKTVKNFDIPGLYSLKKEQKSLEDWLESPYNNLLDDKLNLLVNTKSKAPNKKHDNPIEIENFIKIFINNKINKFQLLSRKKNYLNMRRIVFELFRGYTLFFNIKLDYCLNPSFVPCLSVNESNILFNTIEDYKSLPLNKKSIMALLLVYYSADNLLILKYKNLLYKNSLTFSELKLFFFNNWLKKKSIYINIIENELKKIFLENQKFTHKFIQIDTSFSYIYLIAVLTGNYALLKLFNSKKNKCILKVLTNNSLMYLNKHYKKNYTTELINLVSFLKHDVKIQNLLFKGIIITQDIKNTGMLFKKSYEDFFNTPSSYMENKLINIFLKKYIIIVNNLFPNFTIQLELINKILNFIIDKEKSLTIKTIDDSVFKWELSSIIKKKRKYYHPLKKKHMQYRLETSNLGINFRKIILLDHFITFINNSIFRQIISLFSKKNKNILILSDNIFLIKPSDLFFFEKTAYEVYTHTKTKKLARSVVLDKYLKNYSKTSDDFLKLLMNQFLTNMSNIPQLSKKIIFTKIYKLDL
ncbi:MAG: hypothetical protein H8E55_72820 [Pelagibacterales bacterium]|nr:hypothetical protein [Pelagibacterales bacterium]